MSDGRCPKCGHPWDDHGLAQIKCRYRLKARYQSGLALKKPLTFAEQVIADARLYHWVEGTL